MEQEDGRTLSGSGSGERAQGRNRDDRWGSAALEHDAEFGPAGSQRNDLDDATKTDRPKPVTTGRAVREIVETLVLAGLIFLLVRLVVLNFRVDGESMTPNLQNEQMLLVNVNAYRHFDLNNLIPGRDGEAPQEVWPFGKPERGDIIVFNPSPNAEQPYIKRVIGLPGEHVTFQDGYVYIDGQRLDESYIDSAATRCRQSDECDVVVSPDHVYVLGDNRTNSTDSRIIGEVPLSNIVGKAWLSYWPLDLFGFVPHYEYVDQPGGDGASTSQVAPTASPDQDETPAERRERRNAMREAQGVPTLVPVN
jgi:signal peptidase I